MRTTTSAHLSEIGARLRAHRMGKQLSPDTLAARLGISRAALYRVEKGEIAKIEMLNAIASELDVTLTSLLGVGIEYVPSAVGFFERMRQVEEDCDQIVGLFSPVSYLVTSPEYDRVLADVLQESARRDPTSEDDRIATQIMSILQARKQKFYSRRPLLASLISGNDLERFLRNGLEGRHDLPEETVLERRRKATAEVRHMVRMLLEPDIGIQIGIARESIPATSFQVVRKGPASVLLISPFRLGQDPNIRVGVGLVTSSPEATALHERIAKQLWETALKGQDAADYLKDLIARFGIE